MFGKITYKKVKLPFHYIKEEVEQGTLANSMNDQRFDAIEFLCSSISNVSAK